MEKSYGINSSSFKLNLFFLIKGMNDLAPVLFPYDSYIERVSGNHR